MRPAPADDPAELVGRMRRGDASAWREVVDRYEPLLRRFACRNGLSADDADDAVQLTWLRCVGHLGQLTQADRLRAWLISICRRESVHLAIRARREVQLSEPETALLINDGTAEGDPCGEVILFSHERRWGGSRAACPRHSQKSRSRGRTTSATSPAWTFRRAAPVMVVKTRWFGLRTLQRPSITSSRGAFREDKVAFVDHRVIAPDRLVGLPIGHIEPDPRAGARLSHCIPNGAELASQHFPLIL